MPAGNKLFLSRTNARAAPASTTMLPQIFKPLASHCLRADNRGMSAVKKVPNSSSPSNARASAFGSRPSAIKECAPLRAAAFAARSLPAMPPEPTPSGDGATCLISESSFAAAVCTTTPSSPRKPPVSVSINNKSASNRLAICAAKRSLSPKRTASVAITSFSFATGTVSCASICRNAARAFKYKVRCDMSSAVNNTCPACRL